MTSPASQLAFSIKAASIFRIISTALNFNMLSSNFPWEKLVGEKVWQKDRLSLTQFGSLFIRFTLFWPMLHSLLFMMLSQLLYVFTAQIFSLFWVKEIVLEFLSYQRFYSDGCIAAMDFNVHKIQFWYFLLLAVFTP